MQASDEHRERSDKRADNRPDNRADNRPDNREDNREDKRAAEGADHGEASPQGADHRALRFLTAGSVDDGKSTLIGRLLFDSRAILADQIDTLERRSAGSAAAEKGVGEPNFDLSLLTDGLEAEREQGITIDVAYRYFATRQRKFIIADAPGHEQYTRNMVTAAAGSDAVVVLVDVTKLAIPAAGLPRQATSGDGPATADTDAPASPAGAVQLLPQTRRHALLARLLRVPSIVFAVNKLDAVADPGHAYRAVREALLGFAAQADIDVAGVIPVSALRGDNVTEPPRSTNAALAAWAAWYDGPSLLQLLEALPPAEERKTGSLMLPVQYVARDGEGTGDQPRTFWGRIAHGSVRAGDEVEAYPSGQKARVRELRLAGESVVTAVAGQSAGLLLDRQLDVSRGDWIATPGRLRATHRFEATLAWLDTEPAAVGRKYWLRHGNRWVQGRIVAIESRLDIATLASTPAQTLAVNDIGRVTVETQQPLPVEPYETNRVAGALIIVDPASNRTSGALLVREHGAG